MKDETLQEVFRRKLRGPYTASVPSYGQEAYEAYCKSFFGRSPVTEGILPIWEKLPAQARAAWEAAGQAAANAALRREVGVGGRFEP